MIERLGLALWSRDPRAFVDALKGDGPLRRAAERGMASLDAKSLIVTLRTVPDMASTIVSWRPELISDARFWRIPDLDRKSTRLNSVTNAHLVCRLLLEKKKITPITHTSTQYQHLIPTLSETTH